MDLADWANLANLFAFGKLPPELQSHVVMFTKNPWFELITVNKAWLTFVFTARIQNLNLRQYPAFPLDKMPTLNLTALNVWRNRNITSEHISRLIGLKRLAIGGITQPLVIRQFTNLTFLDLGNNHTVSNKCVRVVSNILNSLSLTRNPRINDQTVAMCTNLTSFNLLGNTMITNMGISRLTQLTYLSLFDNANITDMVVKQMTSLTKLVLVGNGTITDDSVSRLLHLKSLDLGGNSVITNASVSKLTALTVLSLACNRNITNSGIATLTNLTSLNVDSKKCKITYEGLYPLVNLTSLFMARNYKLAYDIIELPAHITRIDLSGIPRISPHTSPFLSNITALTITGDNGIEDHELALFTNLKILNITMNPLVTMLSVSQLTSLTTIAIRQSAISRDMLTHMSRLHISV